MLTTEIVKNLSVEELRSRYSREELLDFAGRELERRERAQHEEAILFYEPVSDDTRRFHLSLAQQRIALGGNGSGKSESGLADLTVALTGVIPASLYHEYPKEKLRPPISARLIVQSLTSTWEQTIKPKLQWDHWTGLADGKTGHWGWIPKRFLIKGRWDESWSEKYRTLTLINGSTLQVMSHGQDVLDFASASVHYILVDEGPRNSVWRENMMRLREGGYISLAMTPPDDESASWDAAWVYDELYEKGIPGPARDPDIESFTFFTENNRYLAADFMAKTGKGFTPAQRETRFHGRFMHLGGRIYPTYTNRTQVWCFTCNDICIMENKTCAGCGGTDTVEFCHLVEPLEEAYTWPCVYLLDPHPRKPNMMVWVAVDPFDDWWVIAEAEVDKEPEGVRDRIKEVEEGHRLNICHRIIDPNMGRSAAHNAGPRTISVSEEFAAVGIRCDDRVGDSFDVAKNRIRAMLKPDPRTRKPRLHVFNTCRKVNEQMMKWTFDEFARYSADKRDPKQTPKEKHSDMPTLLGYLANSGLTYYSLSLGGRPFCRAGMRGGY